MKHLDEALKKVDFAGLLGNQKPPDRIPGKGDERMKTKKKAVKKSKSSSKATAVKDDWGFKKGSLSSQAIKMLADGKATLKDARKKFKTLSFGILLAQLERNGFKVSEDAKGLCSVKA